MTQAPPPPRGFPSRLEALLRCPVSGARLVPTALERGSDETIRTGILAARTAGLWYPVINGVPHLLPYATEAMEDFARRYPEAAPHLCQGLALPPHDQTPRGAEEGHYERHGIAEADRDPFDTARREAAEAMVPESAATLLDVGAGPGFFLNLLERRRPKLEVLGLERSGAAVTAAVCAAPVILGTAERLPLEDRAVDCLVTMEMLEHLPQGVHERTLAEMTRVAGRHILVNVPYRERRLQAECPACGCRFNPHFHMRSYDDRALDRLLPGFRPVARRLLPRSYSLLKALAAPFRKRVLGGFISYAACPQCGYRAGPESESGGGRDSKSTRVLRALDALLPQVPVRGEILVLYERAPA